MQIISGIAISFDGETSHYLPLPPLLPSRLPEWHCLPAAANASHGKAGNAGDIGVDASDALTTAAAAAATTVCGGCDNQHGPVAGEGTPSSTLSWESLPRRAVEDITVCVGFPWLCAGWSSELHQKRRRQSNGNRGRRRRFKCWNQALLVCRRWNALGVDALNRYTVEEPSSRWGLLRDAMENQNSTKVCMDMKAALVCLRGLGIRVKGPLEDPAVANWLVEPPIDEAAAAALAAPPTKSKKRKAKTPRPPPRAQTMSLSLRRQPNGFVDLWCIQAAATLSLMAKKESKLQDLSLTLPFHLIEMPAVVAAASMEYYGLSVKVGRLLDMRREVDQRLRDLRGLAEQVAGAGDVEDDEDKTILASSKRLHDMLYLSLQFKPPPSWKKHLSSSSTTVAGSSSGFPTARGGNSKQAKLGPTDTASLEEMLSLSSPSGPKEDPNGFVRNGFVRAVIEHRVLAPASSSFGRLVRAKRWHPHLEGVRVNPHIELLTNTGRMVTSDPPLQNLDHKIRLTRSWRLSLAEEMEADVPDVQVIPRAWADNTHDTRGGTATKQHMQGQAGQGWKALLSQGSVDEEQREGLK